MLCKYCIIFVVTRCEIIIIINPVLQVKTLRHQDCAVGMYFSEDLSPGSQTPKHSLLLKSGQK